jgi:hypothetical protein
MRRRRGSSLALSGRQAQAALGVLIHEGKLAAGDVRKALQRRDRLIRALRASLAAAPYFPILIEGGQGDPMIVTDGLDSFDMSLMDVKGKPVTNGEFQVSLCPVTDHRVAWPNSQVDTRPCPANLVSSEGVILNVRPIERGYMGLMVSKAPATPGIYFFRIQPSASNTHTWRVRGSLNNGIIYIYAVTVEGADIIDENYQVMNPLVVRQAKQGYVRLIDTSAAGSTQDLTVQAFDNQGVELESGVPITVTRIASSSVFIAPITLLPDGDTLPQGVHAAAAQAVRTSAPTRTMPGGLSILKISQGTTEKGRKIGVVPYKLKIEFADQGGVTLSGQHTLVEPMDRNYAEKTYLSIKVVNPHKGNAVVTRDAPPCALIRELPMDGTGPASAWPAQVPAVVFNRVPSTSNPHDNNEEHGGDVLDEPGYAVTLHDGVSEAREGEGSFFLRAVARRRELKDSYPTECLLDFGALIYATSCPTVGIIDPSEPRYLDMWVDQEDLFPRESPPGPHPARHGTAKVSIDWIEKEALDILAWPAPGEEDAFNSVEDIWSDDYDPSKPDEMAQTGQTDGCPYCATLPSDPKLNHRIHFNHAAAGLRWGSGIEEGYGSDRIQASYDDAGAKFDYGAGRFDEFAMVMTHEARHSLEAKISLDLWATNDPDTDFFVTSLVGSGVTLSDGDRMLDTASALASGMNPEFSLHEQDTATADVDCVSAKQAFERDAILHQRGWTAVQFQLNGVATPVPSFSVTAGQRGLVELATVDKAGFKGIASNFRFAGNLGRVEVITGGCAVSDGTNTPATAAVVYVAENKYQVHVHAPNAPGESCALRLTPYLPTDGSGSPLVPGTAQTFSVGIVPP